MRRLSEVLHFGADCPVGKIAEYPASHDEQTEHPPAHRVRDRFHQRRLSHRIAGHEEKAVNHQHRDHPMRRHVREKRHHHRGHHQGQRNPAFPAAVAQAAEERIAYYGGDKNPAQGESRPLRVVVAGLLQEE